MKQINLISVHKTTGRNFLSSTQRVGETMDGNIFSYQMPTKRRETNKFETFN
jgi:hypothetical protein